MNAPTHRQLAAWLGYRPARAELGSGASPTISADWLAEGLLPYVTYNRLQEEGRLPATGAKGVWTREARQRAILAWARALLDDFEAAHPGDDGARRRVEAGARYLRDPSPENDISLGLLFNDGPGHPGFELAGLACRAISDPSEQDLAGIFGKATKRATLTFSSDPSASWYQADLSLALWILRAELVPWAMGLADPLTDGPSLGQRLISDPSLWEPLVGSDWEALIAGEPASRPNVLRRRGGVSG